MPKDEAVRMPTAAGQISFDGQKNRTCGGRQEDHSPFGCILIAQLGVGLRDSFDRFTTRSKTGGLVDPSLHAMPDKYGSSHLRKRGTEEPPCSQAVAAASAVHTTDACSDDTCVTDTRVRNSLAPLFRTSTTNERIGHISHEEGNRTLDCRLVLFRKILRARTPTP